MRQPVAAKSADATAMKRYRRIRGRRAYTLIEILVVVVIMGFLVALVAPRYAGVVDDASYRIDRSQMQMIKSAALEFYNDVGFVPDNVSLLIYPFENCVVKESNWNDMDSSETCRNMIAFVDRHYKFDDTVIRDIGVDGDNGNGTYRKIRLVEIIREKLDPKNGGWRGGYLGGNGFLHSKNIKTLGNDGTPTRYEDGNRYYFSDQDIKLYYGSDYAAAETLHVVDSSWNADKANKLLYPVQAADFNGTLGTSGEIKMDAWYENRKYRDFLIGSMIVLDSFGTPFEIQIPTKQALAGAGVTSARTKYARIVSFGKNRRRDTDINTLDIDYSKKGYDDSVLYIFEHNLTSYFHPRDAE
ncbi:MAG: prepilin-type N-terminal cleavage/methylation domain-containing protein [Campylobacterales bacterium]|nr:prepilin-type N-terminal cleavage/methylation domain-containing protein [Campylobacterales bacterium]HEO98176.1 prepilin-type N-terminal cleavage/methylation domain-containing protein [Campylobacterota bacterium]